MNKESETSLAQTTLLFQSLTILTHTMAINNNQTSNNMKEFKNLEFNKHPNFEGLQATMIFPNNYGVSVIRFKTITSGYGSYTSNENEWEVAVMHNDRLCYDTPITDDVIGHCSSDDVTEIMKKVQELPKQ